MKISKVKNKGREYDKQQQKNNVTYKEFSIRLSAYFSAETLQTRREWRDIFKALQENNTKQNKAIITTKTFYTRILCLAKISLRIEEEITEIFRPVKAKVVHYQETDLIRNVKGTFKLKRNGIDQ